MFYFLLSADEDQLVEIPCLQDFYENQMLAVIQITTPYISTLTEFRKNTLTLIERYYANTRIVIGETHHISIPNGNILCDLYMIHHPSISVLRQLHPDSVKEFINTILTHGLGDEIHRPYTLYYRHIELEPK